MIAVSNVSFISLSSSSAMSPATCRLVEPWVPDNADCRRLRPPDPLACHEAQEPAEENAQ